MVVLQCLLALLSVSSTQIQPKTKAGKSLGRLFCTSDSLFHFPTPHTGICTSLSQTFSSPPTPLHSAHATSSSAEMASSPFFLSQHLIIHAQILHISEFTRDCSHHSVIHGAHRRHSAHVHDMRECWEAPPHPHTHQLLIGTTHAHMHAFSAEGVHTRVCSRRRSLLRTHSARGSRNALLHSTLTHTSDALSGNWEHTLSTGLGLFMPHFHLLFSLLFSLFYCRTSYI